jgi:hypothetical protein
MRKGFVREELEWLVRKILIRKCGGPLRLNTARWSTKVFTGQYSQAWKIGFNAPIIQRIGIYGEWRVEKILFKSK